MELIDEGTSLDDLASGDRHFGEGQGGTVRLFLDRNLSNEEISMIETELLSSEVSITNISQDAHILEIGFIKSSFPIMTIATVAAIVLATIGVGVFGWQLFKSLGNIPWWAWIAIAAGGMYLLNRRGKWSRGG